MVTSAWLTAGALFCFELELVTVKLTLKSVQSTDPGEGVEAALAQPPGRGS